MQRAHTFKSRLLNNINAAVSIDQTKWPPRYVTHFYGDRMTDQPTHCIMGLFIADLGVNASCLGVLREPDIELSTLQEPE